MQIRLSRLLGLLGVVVVTASCTSVVRGTADGGEVTPLTSTEAFTDLTAVDFCSLLDERRLEQDEAVVRSSTPGFVRCYVEIGTPAATVPVTIGDLYDAEGTDDFADRVEVLPRSVIRQHYSWEGGHCSRDLIFADDVGVQISVAEPYGEVEVPKLLMCGVADAVTDGVQTALFSIGAKLLNFRNETLAATNPCGLLEDDALNELAGEEMMSFGKDLSGHACYWEAVSAPSPAVSVEFDVVQVGVEVGSLFTDDLAGRPSRTMKLGAHECLVETPHVEFTEGSFRWETVALYARDPDGDHCGLAVKLAELAWSQLPEFDG